MVADPVNATPINPIAADKNGKKAPVLVAAKPSVTSCPEAFRTSTKKKNKEMSKDGGGIVALKSE